MKYITLSLLLLAAMAGRGQSKSDTTNSLKDSGIFIMSTGITGSGWGWSGISIWERHPDDKYMYDSGRIEIMGDTVAEIRKVLKALDSLSRKYWDLQNYTQAILNTVGGLSGTQEQLRRYYAAVDRYNKFVYGAPVKKKRRKE